MPYHAELRYDKALIRSAVTAYWRRTVGQRLPWVCLAMGGFLVYLLVQGQRSWVEGVLGATLFFACAMMVAVFAVHYRNGLAKLRDMREPVAQLRVDEAGFAVESLAGQAALPWSAVQALWRCDGFWLVLLSPAQFITVPTRTLGPDMQAFVLSQVSAVGARIR
jgi:hypothetical protein